MSEKNRRETAGHETAGDEIISGNETGGFGDEIEFSVPSNAMATVRRLWKAMGRQRIRLIIVAVSVVFYTVLSVAAPVYSAGIVDLLWKEIRSAITDGTAFRVTWEHGGREIMILLGIYTATGILYTFQSFVMASFAERLSLELRTQISRKLDRLPLSFFDSHKPGEVLSRATNDLDKMSEVLQTGLLKLLTAVGMVVGSLIMMLRFHIGLTVVFLLFTLLSMFSTKLFAAKTLRYATLRQQAVSRVTGQVEESYSGRTVIRSFNREAKSAQEMRDAVKELADTSRKADFMMNVVNPFIRLVNRLGQAVIAVFAGKLLLDGGDDRRNLSGVLPVCVPGVRASDRGGVYDQFPAVVHRFCGADLRASGRERDRAGSGEPCCPAGWKEGCGRQGRVCGCEVRLYAG